MTEKKPDKKEKSNSSFLKSVKDMAKKLDPDLPMEKEKNQETQDKSNPSTEEGPAESKDQSRDQNPKDVPTNFSRGFKSPKSQKKVSSSSEEKSSQKSTSSNKSDPKSDNPLMEYYHKVSVFIQEDKERIIRIAGIIMGAIFVISGILLLFGSADKISDNVIFGERAVTSAFLVIIGLLIVAGVLAQRIVGKTSFDNLYREVKVVEEKKPSQDDKKNEAKEKIDSSTSIDSKDQKK